jgi:WD40-like Beta Propeller Repeat
MSLSTRHAAGRLRDCPSPRRRRDGRGVPRARHHARPARRGQDLPADVTSDPQRVARFEREARSASALSHPNDCVIHALGSTSDGRRFIAREFVEGQTLRERLSRQQAAPTAIWIAMSSASRSAELATISPDGRRLAYDLRRPGATSVELRIVNIEGGASQLLAHDAVGPVWSPDGTSIMYSYIRLDDPIEGRVAVKQFGGQERFLTDWGTDFVLTPKHWTWRGVFGTSGSPSGDAILVLWSPDKFDFATPTASWRPSQTPGSGRGRCHRTAAG